MTGNLQNWSKLEVDWRRTTLYYIQTCGEERLFNVIHARHKRQPTGLHHLQGM